MKATGPLSGFKVLEIAGVGPTQLAGMLLAEMGATVVRIERLHEADLGIPIPPEFNLMNRSRPSLAVDLKSSDGIETVLRLVESADALFEGFRPGVMERLGIGPEACFARNRRLVFGRLTGWGQSGPLAQTVGHDPNYLAIAGVLGAISGPDSAPAIPLNLIGDGSGALYLVVGLLAAMLEAGRSGRGQVVDAAMVDSSASMMTLFYGMLAAGLWQDKRDSNLFDGGAPFLRPYATSDGKFVVIASLEGRFFDALIDGLEMSKQWRKRRMDPNAWSELRVELEAIFLTRTRDEWTQLFADSDACLSPVLSLAEAPLHPQSIARKVHVKRAGIVQPAPAPRFERTPSEIRSEPARPGEYSQEVLASWGFDSAEVDRLMRDGVIADARSADSAGKK